MTYIEHSSGLLVPAKAQTEKAVTGPGMISMMYDTPLWGVIKNHSRNAQEAQALYHSNPWIRAAEWAVCSRLSTVPCHLELPDGETVTDESPEELRRIRDLILERPYTPVQGEPRGPHPTTRRALWWLTSRHMGLCGTGFWYLDATERQAETPSALLYVNVARLTPAVDSVGNLTGWVMDKDSRNPVPFDVDELLDFPLDPPDEGYFGIGLVESAITKAQLSRLADRHAIDTFASGGRLSGIVSPKNGEGTIDDERFTQMQKSFRAIVEDPQAAKRLLIVKGPVDFQQTSVSPRDLDLVGIANLTRDDIFGVWGVPLSQAGISGPVGLNGGEKGKYEEAVIWQGPVHNRLVSMRETIQYRLLDRYKLLGIELTLVIDEPTFDDEAPKYELAIKAQQLPVKRDEIRAILGLDPLGPEQGGNVIDMPAATVEFGDFPGDVPTKAKVTGRVREAVEKRYPPLIKRAVTAFLTQQRREIAERVRGRASHVSRKPTDTDAWWDAKKWDALLAKALKPFAAGIAETVTPQVASSLGRGKADLWETNVQQHVAQRAAERIALINDTTRGLILAALTKAIEDGLSPARLGDLIEGLPAFDEYRSELVARTETMLAYNDATLRSYAELDVERVEAIDGDQDAECAERNGRIYTVDEAQTITDHPNGSLDWLPVIGSGKASYVSDVATHLPRPKRTQLEYDASGRVVAIVES